MTPAEAGMCCPACGGEVRRTDEESVKCLSCSSETDTYEAIKAADERRSPSPPTPAGEEAPAGCDFQSSSDGWFCELAAGHAGYHKSRMVASPAPPEADGGHAGIVCPICGQTRLPCYSTSPADGAEGLRAEVEALKRYEQTHLANLDALREDLRTANGTAIRNGELAVEYQSRLTAAESALADALLVIEALNISPRECCEERYSYLHVTDTWDKGAIAAYKRMIERRGR